MNRTEAITNYYENIRKLIRIKDFAPKVYGIKDLTGAEQSLKKLDLLLDTYESELKDFLKKSILIK